MHINTLIVRPSLTMIVAKTKLAAPSRIIYGGGNAWRRRRPRFIKTRVTRDFRLRVNGLKTFLDKLEHEKSVTHVTQPIHKFPAPATAIKNTPPHKKSSDELI